MKEALRLASLGRGQVSPNPMVGAVIVKDGQIVGSGYHRYELFKHAEICALEEAGERAKGATVYVSLEPCCHYGRTPPCTEALIHAGVRRVIAAIKDPNPKVAGRGLEAVRSAGIEVEFGLCEEEARKLNEKFIKFILTNRPFVHLKVAASLDGKTATRTGDSKWITGEQARYASQKLRYEYDAILVGVGTVLADNPELTMRLEKLRHKPLKRVVLDRRLRTPADAKLISNEAPTTIFASLPAATAFHTETGLKKKLHLLSNKGVEVVFDSGEYVSLGFVLDELACRQVTSLIVEGGSDTAGRFLAEKLVDKVSFFIAPKLIGGRAATPAIGGEGFASLSQSLELDRIEILRHGQDIELTGYPK